MSMLEDRITRINHLVDTLTVLTNTQISKIYGFTLTSDQIYILTNYPFIESDFSSYQPWSKIVDILKYDSPYAVWTLDRRIQTINYQINTLKTKRSWLIANPSKFPSRMGGSEGAAINAILLAWLDGLISTMGEIVLVYKYIQDPTLEQAQQILNNADMIQKDYYIALQTYKTSMKAMFDQLIQAKTNLLAIDQKRYAVANEYMSFINEQYAKRVTLPLGSISQNRRQLLIHNFLYLLAGSSPADLINNFPIYAWIFNYKTVDPNSLIAIKNELSYEDYASLRQILNTAIIYADQIAQLNNTYKDTTFKIPRLEQAYYAQKAAVQQYLEGARQYLAVLGHIPTTDDLEKEFDTSLIIPAEVITEQMDASNLKQADLPPEIVYPPVETKPVVSEPVVEEIAPLTITNDIQIPITENFVFPDESAPIASLPVIEETNNTTILNEMPAPVIEQKKSKLPWILGAGAIALTIFGGSK